MPAPKGNRNAKGNRGGGRRTAYRPEFAQMATKACQAGFTDRELAQLFGVSETTINAWKLKHVEFSESLKTGKTDADVRVERSLYNRAVGYSFDAVKIFQNGNQIPYVEHVPPDTTACIFWLKNRKPEVWRDASRIDLTNSDRSLTDMFAAAVANANGLTREAPAPADSDRSIN